jgi:iron complex outermembrane receptor protein
MRGSSVHVGIAAQGYLFPAPTGVVDYRLRVPGDALLASVLIGDADYGVNYAEADVQLPIVSNALSIGFGVGYTHNPDYYFAAHANEWTGGWILRWQPTDALEVTPFFGTTDHKEHSERPTVFIDDDGVPDYRPIEKEAQQPWSHMSYLASNMGVIARATFVDGWALAGAVFRATTYSPVSYAPLLENIRGNNEGDYSITALPETSSGSTSGEIRLAKRLSTASTRSVFTFRLTGRDSNIESAAGDTIDYGTALVTSVPQIVPMPNFVPGLLNDVSARQFVPGLAYQGVWQNVGEFTGGVQKVLYHRTVTAPGLAPASDSSFPWLYNGGATAFLSHSLAAYGSYTRGFEEIGTAPINAANRNEPVPAQLTRQLEAGLRYQLLPKLQLVAGAFEIDKPYFNIDTHNVYRHVGSISNRGLEFSLTGDLTDRLNVVSGLVLLQPRVQYQPGAVTGPLNAVAVGPYPGYLNIYAQYRPAAFGGVTLGATLQTTSSRYLHYPGLNVGVSTLLGADIHYRTRLFNNSATFWLQAYNLTNTNIWTAEPSSQLHAIDPRRYELSLIVDL